MSCAKEVCWGCGSDGRLPGQHGMSRLNLRKPPGTTYTFQAGKSDVMLWQELGGFQCDEHRRDHMCKFIVLGPPSSASITPRHSDPLCHAMSCADILDKVQHRARTSGLNGREANELLSADIAEARRWQSDAERVMNEASLGEIVDACFKVKPARHRVRTGMFRSALVVPIAGEWSISGDRRHWYYPSKIVRKSGITYSEPWESETITRWSRCNPPEVEGIRKLLIPKKRFGTSGATGWEVDDVTGTWPPD
jgi:hypothetical protein